MRIVLEPFHSPSLFLKLHGKRSKMVGRSVQKLASQRTLRRQNTSQKFLCAMQTKLYSLGRHYWSWPSETSLLCEISWLDKSGGCRGSGQWPELGRSLAGATGRSNRPFLYFFLQLRPAPAKLWILIERLKFSKFLLNIFIYFCDADNVFINSQSVTVASVNDKYCAQTQ